MRKGVGGYRNFLIPGIAEPEEMKNCITQCRHLLLQGFAGIMGGTHKEILEFELQPNKGYSQAEFDQWPCGPVAMRTLNCHEEEKC